VVATRNAICGDLAAVPDREGRPGGAPRLLDDVLGDLRGKPGAIRQAHVLLSEVDIATDRRLGGDTCDLRIVVQGDLRIAGVVPDRRGTVTILDAAAGAREALCEDHAGPSWVSMEGDGGSK